MPPELQPVDLCITDLHPGGAERMLVELAVRLPAVGFAPRLLVLDRPPPAGRNALVARLAAADLPVEFLAARRWWHAPATVGRLARRFRERRPRLVQGFLFHANTLATLAARRAGVPHLLTGIRVAERRRRGHLAVARLTSRWVERHVCVSRAVAEQAERAGLPAERLEVIANGIDLRRYPATAARLEEVGLAPGRRALLMLGRLAPQKGIDRLLPHLPALFAELPRHDLLIVGEGESAAALRAAVDRLGIAARVHFAGWRDDAAALLAASDLLLLCSRWEGLPNAALEAMASRKPLAALRVEGIDDLLPPDRETTRAQVAPHDDLPALLANVVATARDADRAARLGAANRRRAEEAFSIERMVDDYARLYRRVLADD